MHLMKTVAKSGSWVKLGEAKVENKGMSLGSESKAPLSSLLKAPKGRVVRGKGGKSQGLPPQLDTTVRVNHVYRFQALNSASTACTIASLFGAIGGMCSALNTTLNSFASAFKIHKIKLWPAESGSALNTASIQWAVGAANGFIPDVDVGQDVPEGITVTKSIVSVPPKKSLADDWLSSDLSGSAIIFYLQCSVGTIVDVHLSFCLSNTISAGTSTLTTGTVGAVYYLYLDGGSTHHYEPIRLPTTI